MLISERMLVVEHGQGSRFSNSFVPLEKLTFYRDYYGFRIAEAETDQVELLLRAAADINGRQWKGRKASLEQAMAWPRRDCKIEYQTLSETFVPFELEWGQVRLAVELYAAEQGFQIEEPTHCTEPNGRRTRLNRDTPGLRMRPPPYAPSRTQFADYLMMRGLYVVDSSV
ncbi:DnaT-like ssDNA-binding protein [Pseudomonas sp. Leaf59]|uniref:DnaT-like ssDNA-binding protein n=1 Tax=Pseudomonas sp. Leaf59 TaxID=2876556 RepID=UPI001E6237A5|nr:DnaT-like ssDNA-binding protein [Pseudomonas sp. Leaf59]